MKEYWYKYGIFIDHLSLGYHKTMEQLNKQSVCPQFKYILQSSAVIAHFAGAEQLWKKKFPQCGSIVEFVGIPQLTHRFNKVWNTSSERYKQCKMTPELYKLPLLMFGPKVYLFVADSNCAPSIDNVRYWKMLNVRQFDFSIPKENMKIVAEIYKTFRDLLHNEKCPIFFIF